jgi:hypothetical protein
MLAMALEQIAKSRRSTCTRLALTESGPARHDYECGCGQEMGTGVRPIDQAWYNDDTLRNAMYSLRFKI